MSHWRVIYVSHLFEAIQRGIKYLRQTGNVKDPQGSNGVLFQSESCPTGGGGLVTQSCPTQEPNDCSPPGSSVHGILQARILDWVTISFLGELPIPGLKPRSPTLQVVS